MSHPAIDPRIKAHVVLDNCANYTVESMILYWRRFCVNGELDSTTVSGTFTRVPCRHILHGQYVRHPEKNLKDKSESYEIPLIYSAGEDKTYRLERSMKFKCYVCFEVYLNNML